MTATTTDATVWPGHHQQLGALFDGEGTNFAVWAPGAASVDLCLFGDDHSETRLTLPEHTLGVWHGYVPSITPGQHYGFRVDGVWDPPSGRMFNAAKLLLDPYAKAIDRMLVPHPSLASITATGQRNGTDSAPYVPRSVVVGADDFDWGGDVRPQVPWRRTVIYEAHVRGLTRLNQAIPEEQRGSFSAVGHDSVVGYLKDLGVTSIELLPTQHLLSEPALSAKGLINYWGYNTIGFFAPHAGYSSTGTRGTQVTEFKQLVKTLHTAGLEVIMDVVYNHTAEGGIAGPTLCLRGFDNCAYYRSDGKGNYADVTGCGNTLNVSEPQALQLVMDSLRYWATEMHVDGFRFDLAPALARGEHGLELRAPFLTAMHQDPVLREVKLIAEPWDATGEGYSLGNFPSPWCEWNDKFRDTVRDFWRGRSGGVRDLASRFSGSSDLYADDGRLPFSSVNFVTAHDGFTLRDLVSYDVKHNEPNLENNLDGTDHNRSWNCGVEGETDDLSVQALRRRQAANLLATLLMSTGVPMLLGGDERGHTQRGNNNAFCQDNDVSWLSWEQDPRWKHLGDLTRSLLRLRAEHPVLRQRYFFEGKPLDGHGGKDITWLQPSGEEMTEQQWSDPTAATLGIFLAGDALRAVSSKGVRRRDKSYVLWFHAGSQPVTVTLPEPWADHYLELVRTDEANTGGPITPGSTVTLRDHTFALFEAVARDRRLS
ncbi:MAG: glycogen debranching protein GlgX [Nocardioidaceae bacterium]